MDSIIALTKRNIRLFLRDKLAVFFSFLSTIILLALYFLFIANVYADSMMELTSELLSDKQRYFLIYLQMIAGILILNSISLSMGVFSVIAKDFETRRIDSLLLTPVKPFQMLASYFISGLLVSFVLNTFTWIVGSILIGAITGYWVSAGAFFMTICVLIIASFISSSLMLLVTAVVKSSTAIGVINGIMGTFLGFICGIYMPYSQLGNGIKGVGSFLPFTHLTIWIKNILIKNACSQIGANSEMTEELLTDFFSAGNIGFCGLDVPLWGMLLLSATFAIGLLVTAYILLKKRLSININNAKLNKENS